MGPGTWDCGRGREGTSCVTRQTTNCPCCTSHPVSWVRAALLVHPLTSLLYLVASHFPCSTRTPPRKWCASPGEYGSALVGVGLSESCGTHWASTGCADAAMRRPSSRLSCPMMPCSLLLDGPQRQIQIRSRIESHHHGACCQACCQATQGAETSRPKRDEPTRGLHSTAQCSVPHQYASRPHLKAA